MNSENVLLACSKVLAHKKNLSENHPFIGIPSITDTNTVLGLGLVSSLVCVKVVLGPFYYLVGYCGSII